MNYFYKILSLACVGTMVLSSVGCAMQKPQIQVVENKVEVATEKPIVGNINRNKSFVGKIVPNKSVPVLPKVPDKVIKTTKNVGDIVKKGELLFCVDTKSIEQSVDLANASLELEKIKSEQALGTQSKNAELQKELQFKRNEDSYETQKEELEQWRDEQERNIKRLKKQIEDETDESKKKSLESKLDDFEDSYDAQEEAKQAQMSNSYYSSYYSKKDYERQIDKVKKENEAINKANVDKAQIRVKQAYTALEKTNVYAPIDGIIELKDIKVNQYANPTKPAYIIANKNIMTVEFGIPDTYIKNINIGDEVTVTYNQTDYDGVITQKAYNANAQSGLFNIKVAINTDGKLLTGTTVKVDLVIQKSENAILINPQSVYYDNDKAYVFVANNDKAEKRMIEMGVINSQYVEVTKGLNQDDSVIITKNSSLFDGVEIINNVSTEKSDNNNDVTSKEEE